MRFLIVDRISLKSVLDYREFFCEKKDVLFTLPNLSKTQRLFLLTIDNNYKEVTLFASSGSNL